MYKLVDMPYEELLGWYSYFERRPIGWREDDRTHKLLQAQGVEAKPWAIFSSLVPIYHPPKADDNDSFDVAGFKQSGFFGQLLSARGGDKLEV